MAHPFGPLPYTAIEGACSAAGSAHFCFGLAEEADVDARAEDVTRHLTAGLIEVRRMAAHLGYGLVDLDRAPLAVRVEAMRLLSAPGDEPEEESAPFTREDWACEAGHIERELA